MTAGLKRGDIVAGLLYLVLLVALLAATILVYTKAFTPAVKVTLQASNAGSSLQTGADVKMHGVLVGRVDSVDSNGDGATIGLSLDPTQSQQIPSDAEARLLPKTLLGERYVSLVAPGTTNGTAPTDSDTTPIVGDAVIHEDTSAEAVELQQALDDLLPLLTAVQPEKLASTLGEINSALRGRGSQIGDTFTETGRYLKQLDPELPRLSDDFAALAKVADTYADAAPDLLNALSDFTTFAQTQVDQQQQLAALYATVIGSANTTTGFVQQNQSNFIALSRDSLPALDVTARYASEFPCTLQALTGLIPKMDKALGAGTDRPGVHGTLTIVPSRGKYVAGRDAVMPSVDGSPTCPYVPTGTPVTAPDGTTTTATSNAAAPRATAASVVAVPAADSGLGMPNSVAENQWIAGIVAPTEGIAPSEFPSFASLVLGPAMRGSVVEVK